MPAIILKPAMLAAIDVQQHARQRAPRTPLAMNPALTPTGDQPGSLQHSFDPAVTELNLLLGAQLFVKVTHVQIEILLPVELQNALHHCHRYALRGRLAPPPVKYPAKAKLLISLAPA